MRAYELEELTAYFGSEKSSAWKCYAPAFEHLSDNAGNPRIAFSWVWPGFFLGPCYLFARKSYLVSFALITLALVLSYVHIALFFAVWCATAMTAPYFIFRRFLRVVQAGRNTTDNREARLKYIENEGGISAWVGVLELLP